MSTFMSREVLEGITKASKEQAKKSSRMRVQMGEQVFPILRLNDTSFAMDNDGVPKLRGYVDILDGTRLRYRALIIASETEANETIFEFKQSTSVALGPALDFEQRDDAPVGYITAG